MSVYAKVMIVADDGTSTTILNVDSAQMTPCGGVLMARNGTPVTVSADAGMMIVCVQAS